MKLHLKDEYYKIYQGSMLDLLEIIESNTIDSVVTDPPYELNFMNKGWDRSGIAFQKETWQKCYEVLKPGGYLLAFGGSRTSHRIAVAVEDAGFEIRDVIMWVYGSGFPKSMNVSKALDKHFDVDRKVIGKTKGAGTSGEVMKTGLKNEYNITEPSTDLAKKYEGWGTQLKPSYEPIIVARKPLIGTVAQNILEYGVGGINIDECRVGDEIIDNTNANPKRFKSFKEQDGNERKTFEQNGKVSIGRFPANMILGYLEDEYLLKDNISKQDKKKVLEWLSENT